MKVSAQFQLKQNYIKSVLFSFRSLDTKYMRYLLRATGNVTKTFILFKKKSDGYCQRNNTILPSCMQLRYR